MSISREDETAGATEHFEDAALYDHDYRRRRADVQFYRTLAAEHGGPVLDLACGTGRIMVPLLRDGHTVVGWIARRRCWRTRPARSRACRGRSARGRC